MFCLFGDTLSFMMFSSFSSAVLLLHNQTQSICATPITFFEQGDLERAQETHTLCVFDRLPVVSWRRAKYKQMYGLKSTLTVSP